MIPLATAADWEPLGGTFSNDAAKDSPWLSHMGRCSKHADTNGGGTAQ